MISGPYCRPVGGPECIDYSDGSGHSPREFFDEIPGTERLVVGHAPKSMYERIRAPSELIGVIKAVAEELEPLASRRKRRNEGLVVSYRVAYAGDFVFAEGKRG